VATHKIPFLPPLRIESEFRRAIQKLFLVDLPPNATVEEIQQKILAFTKRSSHFEKLGEYLARRMVTQVRVQNARSWREAAVKASRGREIYEALQNELHGPVGVRVQELVRENARLIRSVPDELRESVARFVATREQEGVRPDTIAHELRSRLPHLTRSRIALIARTETSKAASALTEARSEQLGIAWFQWQTAEDMRVRASHRLFDKVLVRFNDLPDAEQMAREGSKFGHYGPGGCPNCRCVELPLISLDLIAWPCRVYHDGQIERMTRSRFGVFSGMERSRAA
jgi:uncharacterized protein with gpF-like domain